MAMTMYVQIKDPERERYITILILQEKPLANFIAKQKGGRAISQTALQRTEGIPALKRAVEEATSNPMPTKEFEKLREGFLEAKMGSETTDFIIKLPKRYHKIIKKMAMEESTSMNKWIIAAIKRQLKEQKML